MFNKKSEFNFKAITDMDCYILRKPRLYDIFSRYPEIAQKLKYTVLHKYRNNIRNPLTLRKEETE
jgi:hypothetical protein